MNIDELNAAAPAAPEDLELLQLYNIAAAEQVREAMSLAELLDSMQDHTAAAQALSRVDVMVHPTADSSEEELNQLLEACALEEQRQVARAAAMERYLGC